MSNVSAKLTTGSVRLVVPSKEMSSTQRDVVSSTVLQTTKEQEDEYKMRLKERQKVKTL